MNSRCWITNRILTKTIQKKSAEYPQQHPYHYRFLIKSLPVPMFLIINRWLLLMIVIDVCLWLINNIEILILSVSGLLILIFVGLLAHTACMCGKTTQALFWTTCHGQAWGSLIMLFASASVVCLCKSYWGFEGVWYWHYDSQLPIPDRRNHYRRRCAARVIVSSLDRCLGLCCCSCCY